VSRSPRAYRLPVYKLKTCQKANYATTPAEVPFTDGMESIDLKSDKGCSVLKIRGEGENSYKRKVRWMD